MPNGGKKGLTQQSTGIGERFFISGWWSLTNVAAYNTQIFIMKSADMDGDRWGWRDRANNNKQRTLIMDMINEKGVQSAYCNESPIQTIMKKLRTQSSFVLMDDTLVIQQLGEGIV